MTYQLNTKNIANARLSKQHKIVLSEILPKLKTNPNPANGNNFLFYLKSLRVRHELLRGGDLNIIKSRAEFGNSDWRINTSGEITKIVKQICTKAKNISNNKSKNARPALRDNSKNVNYKILAIGKKLACYLLLALEINECGTLTWPRWRVRRIHFCTGRLWRGIEAMFRGLIHIPYLCVGCGVLAFTVVSFFVLVLCCAAVSRHQFSFAPGVGSFVRWFRFC